MKLKVEMPTDEEDAAIQRGIDLDPDNPELGDDFFAQARPASEMMPPELYAELVSQQKAGAKRQTEVVLLEVSPEVAAKLRAMGPGWQATAGAALARLAKRAKAG